MSDTIKMTKSSKDTLSGLPAHQLQYTSTGNPGIKIDENAMENVKEIRTNQPKTSNNGPTVLIDEYYG